MPAGGAVVPKPVPAARAVVPRNRWEEWIVPIALPAQADLIAPTTGLNHSLFVAGPASYFAHRRPIPRLPAVMEPPEVGAAPMGPVPVVLIVEA